MCCEEVTRQERRQPGRQIKFRLVGFRSVKDNGQQRARRARLFFFSPLVPGPNFFPVPFGLLFIFSAVTEEQMQSLQKRKKQTDRRLASEADQQERLENDRDADGGEENKNSQAVYKPRAVLDFYLSFQSPPRRRFLFS